MTAQPDPYQQPPRVISSLNPDEGGPVTYLDREGGVVLLHPSDWGEVWREACRAPEFGLAATSRPTSIYGVPVQLDRGLPPGTAVVRDAR